ncbi:putative Ctr copper transporter family-domain-containing protein [Seiridium cardinale]
MDMSGMTMATSTTMSSMTMTSSSAMSTSTAMDMDMSSDSSILMTSAEMAMVFFQSATTPLYSSAWTPSGQGPYAGTCVFLIVLATIHRILHAIKSTVFDGRPQDRHAPLASQNGEVEGVKTAGRQLKSEWRRHPFRVADETARALFEVIVDGIGYLL